MSTDSETVVLVADPELPPDVVRRVRELETTGATIIAWQHTSIVQDRFPSPDVRAALAGLGIESRSIADVLGSRIDFDIDDAVIAWFKAYGHDRFRGRFRHGAMDLWWWAELYLYHETPLRLAVRDVEALARIVERARPTKLVVVRPVRALDAAATTLVPRVEVLGRTVASYEPRTVRRHAADLAKLIGTGLKSLMRREPLGRRCRVFFLTHGSMWRGDREMYFDRILPAVEARATTTVVAVGPPVPFKKRGFGPWIRDLLEIDEDALRYRPIRRYFTFSMSLSLARAFADCRRMWRRFARDPAPSHRKVSLGEESLVCFRDTFYRQLPWAIRAYHEIESVLAIDEPDVLVLYAESSGLGRAAISAANARGVPSFAIQHGIMYRQYYSHEHAAYEVGPVGVDDGGVPLPTRTAVYGSAARDLLIERGHYQPERIVITGSPKFDDLVRAAEGFDAEAIRRDLGVGSGEKVLVLASRWTAVGPVLDELVEAVERVDGVRLVVKPHQAESTGPYEDVLASRRPTKTRILPASANLLELLFASDGLVTVDSFASSEALVLGRPVLVVNLPSNLDALVERGVALGVKRGDAIEPELRKLFDPGVARELEATRKEYIQEFAFGADGRSTERIVDAIFDTCRSSP